MATLRDKCIQIAADSIWAATTLSTNDGVLVAELAFDAILVVLGENLDAWEDLADKKASGPITFESYCEALPRLLLAVLVDMEEGD